MTYVKKRGSRKRWSKEETELFYQALRKYGTDFEMISGAMPGRSRYDIRNKFKAEEKIHGSWITTALLRRPRPTPVSAPVVPQDGIPSELANYSMATSPKPANDEELPEPGNLIAPAGRAQEPSTEAEAAPGGGNADIFDLGLLTPATQPR
ncbi:hypothetical protein GQ54DRAFT_257578 [Martensiomyces pterosporus]|nr:hypothetical protein GQ54DRAFT_257578 [Martensiomyces pterosporus]